MWIPKKGDRVRAVENDNNYIRLGEVGIVLTGVDRYNMVEVDFFDTAYFKMPMYLSELEPEESEFSRFVRETLEKGREMMTKYRCTECDSEDSDHQSYTPPPPALVCWNCKAGSKASVAEQLKFNVGMMPEHKKES